MKTTKYTKWLLAACMLLAAPVFTACDDDDDVVAVEIPENFAMDLSSLNIDWNETEGVVELEANNEWRAESNCTWITIDPSKGEPEISACSSTSSLTLIAFPCGRTDCDLRRTDRQDHCHSGRMH